MGYINLFLWSKPPRALGFPHVSFPPTGAPSGPGLVWFLDQNEATADSKSV